jgi:tRNA (cytidine/uridine-2'-O-)-methyltransferase
VSHVGSRCALQAAQTPIPSQRHHPGACHRAAESGKRIEGSTIVRIALYQPDIAGNVGTILRLAACWQSGVDIILPCGFPASDAQLRRAAMDYGAAADVTRHADFAAFSQARLTGSARLIALTGLGETPLYDAQFLEDDILLLGRESAGLPPEIRAGANLRVRIPMAQGFRSLNLAVATGIALGEAMRQTALFSTAQFAADSI